MSRNAREGHYCGKWWSADAGKPRHRRTRWDTSLRGLSNYKKWCKLNDC